MRTPVVSDDSPTIREMRSWAPRSARRDGASTNSGGQSAESARERPTTRPPSSAAERRSHSPAAVVLDRRSTALLPHGQVLVVGSDHAVATAVQCVLEGVYDVVACSDPREAVLGIVR